MEFNKEACDDCLKGGNDELTVDYGAAGYPLVYCAGIDANIGYKAPMCGIEMMKDSVRDKEGLCIRGIRYTKRGTNLICQKCDDWKRFYECSGEFKIPANIRKNRERNTKPGEV